MVGRPVTSPRAPGASELNRERRYALLVAYDGSAYHGFQLQAPGLETVAAQLEAALARISPEGASGERVVVLGASRTDAGVHALGQVCAFTSRLTVPAERLPVAINRHLPPDIVVLAVRPVGADFDPVRDALTKRYRYQIWRSAAPSPFWRRAALHLAKPLDLGACRSALGALGGEHDFAAFRDVGSSAVTTVRTVFEARLEERVLPRWHASGGELVTLHIQGNGFLYHMVRIIVGTLIEVGWGRLPPTVVATALKSGRRADLGPTAPAHGLWLEQVAYDPQLFAATGGESAGTMGFLPP